jgi:bacteriorhodopsin
VAVPVSPSLYWAGVVGMAVGIAVIGAFLRTSRREDISHGVLHLVVCVIGLFAYYSLVVDRTAIHVGDRIFYLSHYLYWILTQPLLFVAVALVALPPLANPGDRRLRASLFGGLAGAAVAWTSAGLFQAWSRSSAERWVWFGLAGAALACLVWQMWFPVLHQGQIKGGEHLRDYRLLAGLLTALAVAYQVVWLFGEPGLRLFSATTDTRIFLVLDLLSDVGLGVLSLTLIERLSKQVSAKPGETSVAASARLAEEA